MSVPDLLDGGKNGLGVGKMLSIVVESVEKTRISF